MMGALLPCTLLLALVAAAAADCNCPDDSVKGHLESVSARITHMSAQVSDIDHMVDDTVGAMKGKIPDLHELAERVEHLQGHCDEGYFLCGDEDSTCVSSLAVCDGDNDCPNGHDEHEPTCEMPLSADSHWEAKVLVDDCSTRQPHLMEMDIVSVTKSTFFTARAKVVADVITHSNIHDSHLEARLRVHGLYSYADRTLTLEPPEDDRLAITCTFHRGHVDHCHGHMVHEGSGEECAAFEFHKK